VQWVYFPLHPNTPAQGLLLKDLFAGRGFDLEGMHQRMKALMNAEGLPYERRSHTYNSRLAQELAKASDLQFGVESIHGALYRAYFVEGRNIGDPEVLVDIAKNAGIPEDEARIVLSERTFKDAVDEDWEKASRYGITGVPTFVAGGSKIVGAQPYEALAEHLRLAGARPG
jgi:predicted DsbA family dithiol-disulfide isomerase